MKDKGLFLALACIFTLLIACENRDINEGEKFRPRQVPDDYDNSHFTKITVDGVEYLMMERDNNNPHEGFGFMAFRANKLFEKHDTAIAYLRTINDFQIRIYAKLYDIPLSQAKRENEKILKRFLDDEEAELTALEKNELISEQDIESKENK